jgi:excinuclease ABC subunit B
MQVSGRAARNVNGRVILYGDRGTEAMQHLIDETDRRRKIQESYNKENNITPQTILKSKDHISIATSVADQREDELIRVIDGEELDVNIDNLNKIEQEDVIISLEKKMKDAAKQMKFEVAAIYRDKIQEIKQGAIE